MNKVKYIVWSVLNRLKIGGLIQLRFNSALLHDGWFKSFETKRAVDKDDNPIPWWAYSFNNFIERRLKKSFDVFEYGCGNSTIWLARKVKSIKSVEGNMTWFEKISTLLPRNAKVIYIPPESENYAKEINGSKKKYHIIIIDGDNRVKCIKNSVRNLKNNGVIIFDNTNVKDYEEGIQFLYKNRFKRIDFWGIGPVTPIKTCTSIFYKDKNCIGI